MIVWLLGQYIWCFSRGKGKNMEDEKKEENVTRVSRLLRPTLHLSRGINVAHLTNTKNMTYTKKWKWNKRQLKQVWQIQTNDEWKILKKWQIWQTLFMFLIKVYNIYKNNNYKNKNTTKRQIQKHVWHRRMLKKVKTEKSWILNNV